MSKRIPHQSGSDQMTFQGQCLDRGGNPVTVKGGRKRFRMKDERSQGIGDMTKIAQETECHIGIDDYNHN
ncbi:hypothetical protein DPMN_171243 [Dreissena polymorpha]|uniref:Uncharacterized protein n=1 Tax=Dreissena polymorpha TaxID=45954 RepID=A0A9D4E0V2_DREPO|nr:hypothetical protein DPMN_171243 [Dreissena polymorpha]